ncbi:CBO0543 family protein [Paenibacillus aestuarii]|uniref:CBO0543 family protein n=1 Tax=Paenibacillus aestuarii TaxID=516965 RepID=A0ABW0K3B0_9BACL|nr:CBO0543 family protein [Paenibacillus aestuarii]
MILTTNLAFLAAQLMSRAMKSWKAYYDTVLFVTCMNLLYNLLCKNYLVWQYHPDLLLNHKTTDLLNSFVLLPAATMLYLHFFPSTKWNKFVYYLGWIALFAVIELIWVTYGRITYQYGWTFVWSIVFYFCMFYVIAIHSAHRIWALLISLLFICLLLIKFKVPLGE